MHYHKKIGEVNKHVQCFPNPGGKIMQPEIMTGNGHQKENDQSKKTQARELKFVLEVKRDTKGFAFPNEWNCRMLKLPCTSANVNMVTPRCRRLYNKGRNFLFNRHKGPIANITCSSKMANVEVLRISKVSNVNCSLKIIFNEMNMVR
jgi:hypothetical protein